MRILRTQFSKRLLRAAACSGVVFFGFGYTAVNADEQPANDKFETMLRWGRSVPDSRSDEITLRLTQLFESRANSLNFSRRNLTSLLEEAFPRRFGRLFPFRTAPEVPPDFFFENFAPIGFLVGELNSRVPPILSETKTANWLELKSNRPIEVLREIAPHATLQEGMRAFALQEPWSSEVFSSMWEEKFTAAVQLIEQGGVQCSRSQTPQRANVTSAKPSASTSNVVVPPHFRCIKLSGAQGSGQGIPKQLPRKIGPLNAATNNIDSLGSPEHSACLPVGRLEKQALELIGDEKAGHCFLWRASLDERFHQRSMNSQLICLNARYKSYQKTRFNNVVAVLPSSRADQINIIEGEDGLLSSYRLSLATLSVKKNEIAAGSGQNLRNSQFPRNRTGLYACKTPGSTSLNTLAPFTSPMNSAAHLEWIYVDDALYSGLRRSRPETDVAWRLREVRDGVIDAEKLSWSQLKYDHPSILAEPAFACAAYGSIDAKCALRVVQTALQVSEEWLKGEFDVQQVDLQTQFSIATLVGQSLEKVVKTIPDWSLHDETTSLLSFFSRKAQDLSKKLEADGVSRVTMKTLRKQRNAPKYYDINQQSQDYLAIRNKIFSTSDFWATLKQKPL